MENERTQKEKSKVHEWIKVAVTLISIFISLVIFYTLFIIIAITRLSPWIMLAPISSMLIAPTAFYTKKSKSKTITLIVMLGVIVLSVGYTALRYFLTAPA